MLAPARREAFCARARSWCELRAIFASDLARANSRVLTCLRNVALSQPRLLAMSDSAHCARLARMFIGKRTVSAGVSVISCRRSQVPSSACPSQARQKQHLNEQPFDLLEESLPERRDGCRWSLAADKTNTPPIIMRPLQFRLEISRRIGHKPEMPQHILGCRTPNRAAIASLIARRSSVNHLHTNAARCFSGATVYRRRQKNPVWRSIVELLFIGRLRCMENHRTDSIPNEPIPLSPTGSRTALSGISAQSVCRLFLPLILRL